MTAKKMWFGPRGFEQWIPCPAKGADISSFGYTSKSMTLDGDATIRRSAKGHAEYAFTFDPDDQDKLRIVVDFYNQMFGPAPYFFAFPSDMKRNLASLMWGNPYLAAVAGVPLIPDQRPSLVPIAANSMNYPYRAARYKANAASEKLYVPIPPGMRAWVGFHGSATGVAGVRVTPCIGETGTGPAVTLVPLTGAGGVLVNRSFGRSDGYTGIELDLPATGLLRNLDPNPSFETDLTGASVLTPTGAAALTRPTTGGKDGAAAARATWSAATTAAGAGVSKRIPVTPGKAYSFAEYFRASLITRVKLQVQYVTSSLTNLGTATSGPELVTTASPTWAASQRAVVENVLAPAGSAYAIVSLITTAGTSFANFPVNGWLEVDAGQANVGTTVQAFTSGTTAGWYWTGAINNSVSAQTADTIDMIGVMIQLLKEGEQPATGTYISAQGHHGCEFDDAPGVSAYGPGANRIGMTAKLTEVIF